MMRPLAFMPLWLAFLSCSSIFFQGSSDALTLPYLKNNPNECYFLDDFMPIPKNLVTGRHGSSQTRSYIYGPANYKEVVRKNVMLSFYSNDNKCWSLFEEIYLDEE